MGPTGVLIEEYSRQKHPLGQAIRFDDVPKLVDALRKRLKTTDTELDLSPSSLKWLERRLSDFYRDLEGHTFENDDLVCLVREITAYIGSVLVLHADGRWDNDAPTLRSTSVIIDGTWEVIKDQHRISNRPTYFVIGNGAAHAWDVITSGGKLRLYRMYHDAKSKRLKEHLD